MLKLQEILVITDFFRLSGWRDDATNRGGRGTIHLTVDQNVIDYGRLLTGEEGKMQ